MKKIENRYFAEIWSWWKESPGTWQGDLAEGELRDQEFYDNIFEEVKAFLGRDLAKMLGDYTAHMSASSIRDFVMARLLPLGSTVWKERRRTVEGNTIVKLSIRLTTAEAERLTAGARSAGLSDLSRLAMRGALYPVLSEHR